MKRGHPDLKGKVFGRLTVVKWGEKRGYQPFWLCRCECGTIKMIRSYDLTGGCTSSCGCYRREGRSRRTHGESGRNKSAEYTTWCGMKARCNNPANIGYRDYGGRGIKVCKRWHKFENFLADMGRRPSDNHSIERCDNNRGYSLGNCRWAPVVEQYHNTRRTRVIEHNGECLHLLEWARRTGLNHKTIAGRLNKGWSVGEALAVNNRQLLNMALSTGCEIVVRRPDGTTYRLKEEMSA